MNSNKNRMTKGKKQTEKNRAIKRHPSKERSIISYRMALKLDRYIYTERNIYHISYGYMYMYH